MFFKVFFRIFFLSVLLGTSLSASLFMVFEAEIFFSQFYETGSAWNYALWAAALNEAFLVILSATWLPRIDRGHKKAFHPGNLLIKFLVVFLFLNTVGGASLNVITQKLAKIQEQENKISVLKIRQSQIEDQKNNLRTFIDQNQRVNTVITTREINSIKNQIAELQTQKQSSIAIWLEILLIFLVRFAIQSANITTVWLAGWLFRQPVDGFGIFNTIPASSQTGKYDAEKFQSAIFSVPKNLKNSPVAMIANLSETGEETIPKAIVPEPIKNTSAKPEIHPKKKFSPGPSKSAPEISQVLKKIETEKNSNELQKTPLAKISFPLADEKPSKKTEKKINIPPQNSDAGTIKEKSVADQSSEIKKIARLNPFPLQENSPQSQKIPDEKITPKKEKSPVPESPTESVAEPEILLRIQKKLRNLMMKLPEEHQKTILRDFGLDRNEYQEMITAKTITDEEEWERLKTMHDTLKKKAEHEEYS